MKNFAQNFCIMRVKKTIIAKIYFFHSNFNILNFKSTHAYFLCSRLCHTASLSHCLSCTVSTLKQCSSSLFLTSSRLCLIRRGDTGCTGNNVSSSFTLSRLQVASRCVPRSRWTRGWLAAWREWRAAGAWPHAAGVWSNVRTAQQWMFLGYCCARLGAGCYGFHYTTGLVR